MLHLNRVTHFQFPEQTVRNGIFGKLKGAELKLYLYLLYLAQKKSKVNLFVSAEDIEAEAGISARNIPIARAGLEEHCLIDFARGAGGYNYKLLHPKTGKPLAESSKDGKSATDLDRLTSAQCKKYYLHHLEIVSKHTATSISAVCPFHSDSSPSLQVTLSKGSSWICHGCNRKGKLVAFEQAMAKAKGEAIKTKTAWARLMDVLRHVGAIDATTGHPDAIYQYHDSAGHVLFEVLRYKTAKGKAFSNRRPDPDRPDHYIDNLDGVSRVLYGLPDVLKADTVILVEGEKDCDNLRQLRIQDHSQNPIAITTSPGGAHNWKQGYAKALAGKRVAILPDRDEAGTNYARDAKQSLDGVAREVRVCRFPVGLKDASEYLEEHVLEDIATLIGRDWVSLPFQI